MKAYYFLAMPVVLATLVNVFLTFLIYAVHDSHAQPVLQDGLAGRSVNSEGEYLVGLDGDFEEHTLQQQQQDDKEDPQLVQMPGLNFKAYVRADIATFYREEPGTRVEHKPDYTGQASKFVNMSPERTDLYWSGPQGPVLNDSIGPWAAGGTASFPGHVFIFTKPRKPNEVLCRMKVVPGISVYYCNPFVDERSIQVDPRQLGVRVSGGGRSLDSLSPKDRVSYEAHRFNIEFAALYKNFTGGSEWLTMYPRNPPRHKIWRADYYGQEHHIRTRETQFLAIPPAESLHELTRSEMRRNGTSESLPFAEYRAPGEMNITIKALSCAPRAFEVRNFLSDAEVDHFLGIVKQKALERSTTNGHLSETRTSTTTWIPRHTDVVLATILRRVADTLRLDEALLRNRFPDEHPDYPTQYAINEDIQIVHYDVVSDIIAYYSKTLLRSIQC